MTSATPKSIRDVTLGELSAAARAAGHDATKRAIAAGLKVTTLESLREDDAARARKRA